MTTSTKFHCLFLLILISSSAFAQSDEIRLIIRGDDMGFSHSGNEALIQCFEEGIETSIEVIVPSPWFLEAVTMLKEHPEVDVGIHLDLTCEWDHIKWRPLTPCPSLTDSNGYFFPMVFENKNYPGQSLSENEWKLEEIEQEVRAQIEMAKKHIPQLSHWSAHMGFTWLDGRIKALVKTLAEEYGIDIDPQYHNIARFDYNINDKTPEEQVTSFIAALDKLEPGKTYMYVEHPGLDNEELRSIFHIGYENVASHRQAVTNLWINPVIKSAIKERGIKLISYQDLIPQKE